MVHRQLCNKMTNMSLLCAKAETPFLQIKNSYHVKPKTAILMMNMGGPKTVNDVHGFLLRLFSDKEIINLPAQKYLSKFIAYRRTPKIVKQYSEIGGGSPIHDWTHTQGKFMSELLDRISPETAPHKYYIGFRYVHPLTEESINEIERDGAERVVAFSQYPQYSCTTTGSSINSVTQHYSNPIRGGLANIDTIDAPLSNSLGGGPRPVWSFLDRWPTQPHMVKAFAQHIVEEMSMIEDPEERAETVILFSAHSIPMSVVNRGDPYPQEVGATVQAVMKELNFKWQYRLVWQSKVGPKAWLGPATQDALEGLSKNGRKHAILVPIAFTSDHIETLYEMDIEYCKDIAHEVGMTTVRRAAALNANKVFMTGLAETVKEHLQSGRVSSNQFMLRCPKCVNQNCAKSRRFLKAEEHRVAKWTEDVLGPAEDEDTQKVAAMK